MMFSRAPTPLRGAALSIALAMLAAASAHAQAGLKLPRLDDPVQAAWLQRLAPEFARWQQDPAAYMAIAAGTAAAPCALATADFHRLSGVPDIPKQEKEFADVARKGGMSPGSFRAPRVDNISVQVQGNCVDGKLHGTVQVLARYREIARIAVVAGSSSQLTVLSRFEAANGVVEGEVFRVRIQEMTMDGQLAATRATFTYFDAARQTRSVAIRYSGVHPPKPAASSLTVRSSTPGQGDRYQVVTYEGGEKWEIQNFNARGLHGKQVTLAHTLSGTGVRLPSGEGCYEDGEELKTSQCDVE